MKKSMILLALGLMILGSSCGRRYTCPTYLKNDTEPKTEYRASEKVNEENKKS